MNGSDSLIRELFGIANYDLTSTDETVENGKRCKTIHLSYKGEVPRQCPKCSGKTYSHGRRDLNIVDTPMGGIPTRIVITFPRRRCSQCGNVWQPSFDNVNETRKMTSRAYTDIAQRSLRSTFREVAEDYMLTHVTVKNVFEDFIHDYDRKLRFKTPAFLGIDEIKIKKIGEVTVITDLEHRTLYDMLKGRNQKILTEYFMNMPDREKVLWVCSDMYRPFQKSIGKAMPNARWAIDHFHVVMKANEAVDTIRRELQQGMSRKARINTKRGLAYTLKTRRRDLTTEEAMKIRLLRDDPTLAPLAVAFDLKEDFFDIWDENPSSKDNAMKAFDRWEDGIPEDRRYDSFRTLAQTVHNFHEQIFHYWDCPLAISNGYTECANRLIRETNMKGRGYSFETLRGRSLYRKTNLQSIIDSNGLYIGPRILAQGPLFTTEAIDADEPEEDDDWEPFPEPDYEIDETTGEILD
ncbi:ISL3 family transposase [Bifidobacterium longum subsp. longum]|uniref:ISL3 family transposase n=2 Tax=Bifidobacterium TaxID=1678 RepID=UPI001A8C1AC3|nr:ISL3 family transposase [Bifidobacterium longum]GHM60823.1 ISL3 family transposase [Bifidobacterium longum subsp. longum]